MEKIVVTGGKKLNGEVLISGAKNSALPAMAASLLTRGKSVIRNVPHLRDIETFRLLLQHLGAKVKWTDTNTIEIDTSAVNCFDAPYDLVRTMRASVLVLGPLLAKYGKTKVSLPGGCAIGARPINFHLHGMEQLGGKIKLENGYVDATAGRLAGAHIAFDMPTVTGTENVLMASALAKGKTVIENAACEPEIGDLAGMLRQMGAKISGEGTERIEVTGRAKLKPLEWDVIPDRIETGTFLVAAAITGGEVTVRKCVPNHITALLNKLRESGANVTEGEDWITLKNGGGLKSVDIKTSPYPGFATDMQAQFMALMSLAEGVSVITETVFENRFMHVGELLRMGADITINGNTAVVRGVKSLKGAPVMATDLRASASLIIAGLAAKGDTLVQRIYHIDRGYEKIEKKFEGLGARIKRIS
ncbi:MAG: UDP-N-acetylglucosamine 1-carboxyvinyltransferase [Candidatus Schekmanbacteria bacterium]|nr:UDP-N-acetylglucosamine 1-carboxyvinyltransferase [Candidatus Schekmanbacteria bacterium]